ncbi:MAG TPA: thermonuclease family protein [Candidatus Saccharimonadia bacterium]|nr:thermonuclease family protein [Candidatus Saccharimonadia bacterium]
MDESTASNFIAIHGRLVILHKSPDGDSIRFVPDQSALLERLAHSERLRPSPDGSVQLRFEAIDAPETHYENRAQPLGDEARAWLLELAGFSDVVFNPNQIVMSATPASVPAVIAARMVEANGRPVAYVWVGDHLPAGQDGDTVALPAALLRTSLGAQMLEAGLAYLTLYTSTPAVHRRVFRAIAQQAKHDQLGVWAADATANFELVDQSSIGPSGQLVLPKLFRRCTDYLRARGQGFTGSLPDWISSTTTAGSTDENDAVWAGATLTHLADIVQQTGSRIQLTDDLLSLVFVEK